MTDEGRVLAGRYRVGALIGRGGMADVHVGTDSRLGRQVAIKILKPQLATDPAFRMRFRQEAQSAARMAHPTIVRVFDAGEETVVDPSGHEVQLPFIVMEYVDGRLLKDIVHEGPLEPTAAVRIIDGVLTALEYSHRAGVVHRDIKPGNVMITTTGQVKVMDFGIARAVSDSATTVAQTTAILGTAAYFSPEQAKGETVDARTDLYSTGVVLFEMLTGRPPFRGDTPVAVAYQHVSERPVKPSSLNTRVSPALDTVVMRALEKDRTKRYQSAAEFREEVDLAVSGRLPVRREPDTATALFSSTATGSFSTSELALRQLTDDDTMVRTQRRPPAIWIWSGIVAVVVIVVAVMYWAFNLQPNDTMPSNAREVPVLTGMTYEQAVDELQQLTLPATRVDETSDTVPAGEVIRTDPPSGEVVPTSTPITVYVSTGKVPVAVPDVTNMPLDQAKAALEAAGLASGVENRESSALVPGDTVLGTSPEAGAQVPSGSAVDLRISSGNVTLPDLTGQTLAAASAYLRAQDLQLTPVPEPDDSCEEQSGSPVTRQSPSPGEVPQKSEVRLTYCAG